MQNTSRLTMVGLAGAGLVAGAVLASTIGAQAASPSPTPSTGSPAVPDAHPGDNGADGIPESQEVHGGHGGHGGHGLDLSGTVTALGTGTVTIKTSTATTVYTVVSGSDIDKNGEASLADLAVGDAVTFSVDEANAKQIDKLHAGDETKNRPSDPSSSAPSSNG